MIRTIGFFGVATVLLAASFAAGCGTDKPMGTAGAGGEPWGGGGTGGAGTGGTGTGGVMIGMIPDPGTTVGGEWTDIEPNDDPSSAVPVGVLESSIWMGFAMPATAISSPTDVDNFVFRTGAVATLSNINMQICWSFPGNLLDMNLYDVVQGKKGALVKSAKVTAGTCETLIMPPEGSMLLKADTVYLLEVVAGPMLMLNGDAGLYSA